MSQWSSIVRPMPTPTPFTAAISGLSKAQSAAMKPGKPCSPSVGAVVISPRSWPAENASPAPVTTMARTPGSSSSSRSVSRPSSHICWLKAFRCFGRFQVTTATPPSRSTSTVSRCMARPIPRHLALRDGACYVPGPLGERALAMSILINKDTTVIIQGITGREAVNLTREGLDYGTKIVGGVTPGRAGRDVYGVPVHDCVRDITTKRHVDASIVTVPPRFTRDAVFEAIDAGVKLVVIVTERIPRGEVAQMVEFAGLKGARIIGPNCLGVLSPDEG